MLTVAISDTLQFFDSSKVPLGGISFFDSTRLELISVFNESATLDYLRRYLNDKG